MKQLRLLVVFLFGITAFMLALSTANIIENGEKGGAASLLLGIASGVVCYALAKYWGARDKLPYWATNHDNDRA